MIPEAAVEAAAHGLYAEEGVDYWATEDSSVHRHYRRKARLALEAAAPHIADRKVA